MEQIGTLRHQFLKLDLPIAELPEHLHPMPVYLNPRLKTSFGRYVQRGYSWDLKTFVELKPETLLRAELHRDVVAHEAAHAVVGFRAGHNYHWQAWCLKLGGTGRAKLDLKEVAGLVAEKHLKVVALCTRCAFELRKARPLNPARIYGHRGCGGRFLSIDQRSK